MIMKNPAKLKSHFIGPEMTFLEEAHYGLLAEIEAGLVAIWSELHDALKSRQYKGRLTSIYLQTVQGMPEELGRPTVKPYEVKEGLLKFIAA